MAMWAARKARMILENVRNVLAIEFLAGAQALDFTKLLPGRGVQAARARLRDEIPHLARDRYLAKDIERAATLLREGSLLAATESAAARLASF
jgi:histidine ammonia-lyase